MPVGDVGTGIGWGCATTPRVDWDTRIGNYTYDQAVSELGKPARQDTKPEGTRVAEWLTQRGSPGTIGMEWTRVPRHRG